MNDSTELLVVGIWLRLGDQEGAQRRHDLGHIPVTSVRVFSVRWSRRMVSRESGVYGAGRERVQGNRSRLAC